MKLTSLTLPIDAAERPAWLEAQLVGVELRNLVLELETIRGTQAASGPTLAAHLWPDAGAARLRADRPADAATCTGTGAAGDRPFGFGQRPGDRVRNGGAG